MAASSSAVYALAVGVGVGVAVGVGTDVGVWAAAGEESAACGAAGPPQAETEMAKRTEAPKVPSTDVFNFSPNMQLCAGARRLEENCSECPHLAEADPFVR